MTRHYKIVVQINLNMLTILSIYIKKLLDGLNMHTSILWHPQHSSHSKNYLSMQKEI